MFLVWMLVPLPKPEFRNPKSSSNRKVRPQEFKRKSSYENKMRLVNWNGIKVGFMQRFKGLVGSQ